MEPQRAVFGPAEFLRWASSRRPRLASEFRTGPAETSPTVSGSGSLTDWLNHSEQELAMRNCGYWLSLRGEPATNNTTNVTVYIPRASQFRVAELERIMQRIGSGQNP